MEPNRLKHFRIAAGLSVAELAAKANLTIGNLYRLEAFRGGPAKDSTMAKLSKALDVPEADLFPVLEARVRRAIVALPSTSWEVAVRCPKCQGRFSVAVAEGVPDPTDPGVGCPHCGFTQVVSLRRGS